MATAPKAGSIFGIAEPLFFGGNCLRRNHTP
jgi:hypothetical protein